MLHPRLLLASCLFVGLYASIVNAEEKSAVVVTKNASTSEELPLDPKNPPPKMQELAPGHQAFTHCEYTLSWIVRDTVKSQKEAGGKTTVTITIVGVDLTLDMKSTIWFPRNPSKKLRDHEEGHKKIGDMFYESADAEAKKIGQAWIEKTATGTGSTLDEARQAARQQVGDALAKSYLALMSGEGQKVHDIYDTLTRHGMDNRVKEDDAVRQSIEKWKKQSATPPKR